MIDLRGKVCVITGASSGIGAATARALARAGATVVLAARRKDLLDELAEGIRERGGRADVFRTDVTSAEDLEALRDHVRLEHGRCDVLINNAGIPGGGDFSELSMERIRMVTETNYVSVMLSTKTFLDMLLESRGHVINVASLAGRYALPGASVYAASKHAVVAFTESLLCDDSVRDVRFTAVCPGFVDTPGFPQPNAPRFLSATAGEVANRIVRVIARGEVGTVCVPAWPGPFVGVQALLPRAYRFGLRLASRRYRSRVYTD